MKFLGTFVDAFIKLAKSAGNGSVPGAVVSKSGSYGTQRMDGAQVAERRRQFPTD